MRVSRRDGTSAKEIAAETCSVPVPAKVVSFAAAVLVAAAKGSERAAAEGEGEESNAEAEIELESEAGLRCRGIRGEQSESRRVESTRA